MTAEPQIFSTCQRVMHSADSQLCKPWELLLESNGKYHSIHRKENIEQTDMHKGIQANRMEYISSDAQMWVVQSYTMNQKLAHSYITPTRRARDNYCVISVAPKGIEKLMTVFKHFPHLSSIGGDIPTGFYEVSWRWRLAYVYIFVMKEYEKLIIYYSM